MGNRLVHRIAQRSQLKAALLLIAALVLTFSPIVFGGRTFLAAQMAGGVMPGAPYGYSGKGRVSHNAFGSDPGGSGWQIVAESEKIGQAFRSGRLPLWNPNQMFGTPLAHNMQLSAWFPFRLIPFVMSSPLVWDIYKFLLLFVAGFFTFKFLRLWSVEWVASLTGGVSFMLSGFMVLYINFSFMDVQILIPVLLYLIEKMARAPNLKWFGLLSLLLGCAFLCAYPVPVFLVTVFSACYFLVRAFQTKCAKFIVGFLCSILLGVGVGSVALASGIDTLINTQNVRPPGLGWGSHPFTFLYGMFFPDLLLFRRPGMEYQWCGWNGLIPVVLAIAAFWSSHKTLRAVFGVGAIFCILKLVGLPPASWIAYLPFFDRVIYTRYLQPELAFCIAVLCSLGTQAVLDRSVSLRFLLVTLVLVMVTGWGLFLTHIDTYFVNKGAALRLFWPILWALMFVSILLKREKIKHFNWALFGSVLLLLGAAAQYNRNVRHDVFTKAPYLEFLQKQEKPFRLMGKDFVLFPPYASAFDLDDVRWMNAIVLPYYKRYVKEFFVPSAVDRFHGVEKDLTPFSKEGRVNKFYSLANTRYLLADKKSKGYPELSLVYDKEIKIYKNPNALDRAFVVHKVRFADDEDEMLRLMKQKDFDPATSAILMRNAAREIEQQGIRFPLGVGRTKISITEYAAENVRLEARLNQAGLLVLTDVFYKNWKAYVDGKRVPIFRANLAFRAIALEAGAHQIEFRYEDPYIRLAGGLSLLSLLIGLLCTTLGWRKHN